MMNDDSDNLSDVSQVLSTNRGSNYEYIGSQQRLLDERSARHIDFRNKYFTPHISSYHHRGYCR